MNLTLTTNLKFRTLVFLASCTVLFSQNETINQADKNSNKEQKSVIFTIGAFQPKLSDNSNIGKGTDENMGFKIGAQVFIYQQFFVGLNTEFLYLDVIDQSFTGMYNKSRVSNIHLKVGYELPVTSKLGLGISMSPLGHSNYKNLLTQNRINEQKDSASSTIYQAYLSYEFTKNLSCYIDYSIRNDRTKINTAPEIRNKFNKIQYQNIGFGLKFAIDGIALFE